VTYTIVITNREYGDFTEIQLTLGELVPTSEPIYLKVGEEYDMSGLLKETKATINHKLLRQIDGNFSIGIGYNKAVEIKGTKVKAVGCGIARASYCYQYTSFYYDDGHISGSGGGFVIKYDFTFIVIGEESEYVDVRSIGDLTSESKAFILRNDLVLSEPCENSYVLEFFSGILLNPDGYNITIEESSGLSALCRYNFGMFEGIKLNAAISSEGPVNSICGLTNFNEGFIKDSELNAEIETTRGLNFLGRIYNTTLHCTYTIIPYEGDGENNIFTSLLFNPSQGLKDNDIQFTLRGEPIGIEETDEIIGINTRYRIIIEAPDTV